MKTDMKSQQTRRMEVAEAIDDLREQIIAAQDKGKDKKLKFVVRNAEIEMQIVLTTQNDGEAKLGWSVLSIGGSHKATDAVTHKLRLTLDIPPNAPGEQHPLIGAEAGGRPTSTEQR